MTVDDVAVMKLRSAGADSESFKDFKEFADDPALLPKLSSTLTDIMKALEISWESTESKSSFDTLPCEQAQALEVSQIQKLMAVTDFNHLNQFSDSEDTDTHDHAEKPKSIFKAIASAVINFLLMFGLCCAYGMIMFEHDWNSRHRGMAVKMNLATAFFVGLMLSLFSKIPVAIGGPDLNPVVFLGMFTSTIAEDLAKQHGLLYPKRRLLEQCGIFDGEDLFRQLAGGSSGDGVEFCMGDHYSSNEVGCMSYHTELAATTVFAVSVSSALLGIMYFCLGRFKLVGLVAYIPTNIMEAFLACVGYKVFKYALIFCKYEPRQFIPAACIGVPLYFVKAKHIGNPAILIPLMLLLPLAIFYGMLFGFGGDVASARKDGWFFAEIENAEFWDVWTAYSYPVDSFYSNGKNKFGEAVNFKAWTKTLGDLPIMLIVCLLDCLLKLSSTENKLPVKAEKDYEIQLFGISNFFTTLSGSSVGYMQLKFNVINYGVMGTMDRRGGFLYALMCGVCYFWTTDMFNYLPRFFLSTLLFFAGAGFVAENLWGSRKYLTTVEWMEICGILGVFIIRESLLEAVIFGGLVTGCVFIVRYARVPCIQGHPLLGGELVPSTRRSLLMDCNVRYVANDRAVVMRLKGYIFFASAQKMAKWIEMRLSQEHEAGFPTYRCLKWIIFDCELLDGLDSSASKCMAKLAKIAHSMHVQFIWCGMSEKFRKRLESCGTIREERDWFDTLDTAIHHVHHMLTQDIVHNQQHWINLHPLFSLAHDQAYLRYDFDPFSEILPNDAQYFGNPFSYCERLSVKAYETVLWKPNMTPSNFFLIHSGRIGLFHHVPSNNGSNKLEWELPYAIYTSGWFLNPRSVFGFPTHSYAVALQDGEVLFWSAEYWERLKRDRPHMANAILTAALQQEAEDLDLAEQSKNCECELFDTDEIHRNKSVKLEKMDLISFQQIRQDMTGIDIAQALQNLGLFEPVKESEEYIFGRVPKQIIEDIDAAFQNFSTKSYKEGDEDVLVLPRLHVPNALRYAGIFSVPLLDPEKEVLTRTEFFVLCKRGLLPSLSAAMVSKLRALFQAELTNGDTSMNQDEFVTFFRAMIHSNISAGDIVGISSFWGNGAEQLIDEDAFFAIVSRFIAKYMHYWLVLMGGRELFGESVACSGGQVTLDALMKVFDLEKEVAEEMIWMANFCSDQAEDAYVSYSLDFRLLSTVILRLAPTKPVPLPTMYRCKGKSTAFSVDIDCDETEAAYAWVRSVVADLRDSLPDREKLEWSAYREVSRRPSGVSMILNKKYSEKLGEERCMQRQIAIEAAEIEDSRAVPRISCSAKLWLLLSDPQSSICANVFSILMGILTLTDILTLFLEPIISPADKPVPEAEKVLWLSLEAFFTSLFTLEYILRISVCNSLGQQTRFAFIRRPAQLCDLVANVPFFSYIFFSYDLEELRLFRIARLMRSSTHAQQQKKKESSLGQIAVILGVIWFIDMKNGIKGGARD